MPFFSLLSFSFSSGKKRVEKNELKIKKFALVGPT
jgi:hypothetical protein